eukprot:scaffold429113_cov50-Prasinocladus_malaysianus.AAC.3
MRSDMYASPGPLYMPIMTGTMQHVVSMFVIRKSERTSRPNSATKTSGMLMRQTSRRIQRMSALMKKRHDKEAANPFWNESMADSFIVTARIMMRTPTQLSMLAFPPVGSSLKI